MPTKSVTDAQRNGHPGEPQPADQTAANRLDGLAGETAAASDPFDPESLKLSQDYAVTMGVKKVLTVVPCRKPNRHEFVRVRAGDEWRLETGIFEDKITRDVYLVQRNLWAELSGEVCPACLFSVANRQGDIFMWPVKLPGESGRTNNWNDSALAAARLAETRWVRIAANMAAGMYNTHAAAAELSEPEWPDLSFQEILRLCFQSRFITTTDHPCIRALRGEA